MNDTPPALVIHGRIAEVIRTHRRSWSLDTISATCTAPGCDWRSLGTIAATERAHAAHLATEIAAVCNSPGPAVEKSWKDAEDV
ncbi:hypothetical protein [Mycobacteroides chelonae]|uniref:hypothetical protein n=1 Tax=Mycobacteroides chelonae TaxID=1774 RepID=UPI001E5A8BFE|nr:hypothetical protein [Mycobacteroides chelonae]